MGRNSDRIGTNSSQNSDTPMQTTPALSFVAPTEIVDLPSAGEGYPDGHPLSGKDSIEIRYMTAKDEDILANQSLLKKGVALERLMESIIVDKNIDPLTLLVADRNAILIASRGTAYGYDYEAVVGCTKCGTRNRLDFNLRAPIVQGGLTEEAKEVVTYAGNGLYQTKMPSGGYHIKFRLANGVDENNIAQMALQGKTGEYGAAEQYKKMIKEIEGYTEQELIDAYVDNMIIPDATHLKMCLTRCTKRIRVIEKLTCKNCSHEEEVDVPFGTDFFWPNLKVHEGRI